MEQTLQKRSVRFFPHWAPDSITQLTGLIQLADFIFTENPKAEHWIEIGSYIGESSTVFLSFTKLKKLECVDISIESAQILQKKFKTEIANSRCVIHHCESEIFAASVPISSVDVVYIDGDHSYDQVKNELLMYHPKLRSEGFLCGHDYNDKWPGVIRAVDEFASERNFEIKIFVDSSWILIPRNAR